MAINRIKQLLAFLEETPNDVFLLYALAMEFLSEGDENRAIAYLILAKEVDNDYLAIYYQLAKLFESRDMEKSKNLYQEGMQLAIKQKNQKTLNELRQALENLEED
jgi:Tfp pilus assembly protein PilF